MLDTASSQAAGSAPAANAVKTLTDLVKADMEAVNVCLLDRMQSDVPMIPELAGYLIAAGGSVFARC